MSSVITYPLGYSSLSYTKWNIRCPAISLISWVASCILCSEPTALASAARTCCSNAAILSSKEYMCVAVSTCSLCRDNIISLWRSCSSLMRHTRPVVIRASSLIYITLWARVCDLVSRRDTRDTMIGSARSAGVLRLEASCDAWMPNVDRRPSCLAHVCSWVAHCGGAS